MKLTLLDIVQTVLNDLNGDAVNSIGDTEESEEVVRHVESVFRNLVSRTEWPSHRRAVRLVPYSDSSYPTHMKVEERYKRLCFINYNKAKVGDNRKLYREVKYLPPDHFLVKLNGRNSEQPHTEIIKDPSGIDLLIQNNKAPEWFTSFDDENLVFDSYDGEVDSTLQSSKVQSQAYIIPSFEYRDDFVPDLPAEAFSYLVEESISRCQFKMRQFQDIKSETESQRQSRRLSQNNFVVRGGVSFPNWGKRR